MNLTKAISQWVEKTLGFGCPERAFDLRGYTNGIREKLEKGGYSISPYGLILNPGNGRDYSDNLGELRIEEKERQIIVSPSKPNREAEISKLVAFLESAGICYRFKKGYSPKNN